MEPIAFIPCASDDWNWANPNHMSHGLEEPGGWDRLYEGHINHIINNLGYKNVAFHLPLGKPTGQSEHARWVRTAEQFLGKPVREWEDRYKAFLDKIDYEKWHMCLRQPYHLAETNSLHIMEGCIRILSAIGIEYPGVTVHVYLGSYDEFDARMFRQKKFAEQEALFDEGVLPFEDMDHVAIVFDNLATKIKQHPHARVAQRTKRRKWSQGHLTGFEARLTERGDWLNEEGWACWCWEHQWRRRIAGDVTPYSAYRVPVVRILDGHSRPVVEDDHGGSWVDAALSVARSGYMVAVEPWNSDLPFHDLHADEIRGWYEEAGDPE